MRLPLEIEIEALDEVVSQREVVGEVVMIWNQVGMVADFDYFGDGVGDADPGAHCFDLVEQWERKQ